MKKTDQKLYCLNFESSTKLKAHKTQRINQSRRRQYFHWQLKEKRTFVLFQEFNISGHAASLMIRYFHADSLSKTRIFLKFIWASITTNNTDSTESASQTWPGILETRINQNLIKFN